MIRNRDHKRLRMKEKKIRSPEESIIEKQPNWAKKTRKKRRIDKEEQNAEGFRNMASSDTCSFKN